MQEFHGTQTKNHYSDVTMDAMASQITSLTIVYSIVYSGANQRKHQSSASLVRARGIHRWPVNSPHKGPVTRKMLPIDDVIIMLMERGTWEWRQRHRTKHDSDDLQNKRRKLQSSWTMWNMTIRMDGTNHRNHKTMKQQPTTMLLFEDAGNPRKDIFNNLRADCILDNIKIYMHFGDHVSRLRWRR